MRSRPQAAQGTWKQKHAAKPLCISHHGHCPKREFTQISCR
uniref:Uncharacterized protein n=1 Tax=Arundo donax TaxID=35708 RepID=A0A0A8YN94_ARUDO